MTTIIHHQGCPDGFGAAWLLGLYVGEHRKVAAQHREPVPVGIDDEDVYMVDFVYDDVDKMRDIARRCKTLLVLDHHKTAAGVLTQVEEISFTTSLILGLELRANGLRTAVLDQDRSGAGIVDAYIDAMWPNKPYANAWWVKYVQDRDLWRWEYPTTAPIMAYITSFPYDDESWNIIDDTPMPQALTAGQGINRFRQQLVDDAVSRAWLAPFALDPDGLTGEVKVWHVDCSYTIGSDVAQILAERSEHRFAVYLVGQADGTVKYGLRSTDDGPDVAEIAQRFGGGGHEHAAGFNVPGSLAAVELWPR